MKCYIGNLIVAAKSEVKDGQHGFNVIHEDGYATWIPQAKFQAKFRELSQHERQLLESTDAEHQVAAISDGDPAQAEQEDGICLGWMPAKYNPELPADEIRCARCNGIKSEHADVG